MLGKNERAKRIYEKHIAKHSTKFYDFYDLGIIYTRLKEYDKAEKMLKKSLELKNNYPKTFYALGWLFHEQQKFDKAASYYEEASKFKKYKNNARLFLNLGHVYSILGISEKAVDAYKRTLHIDGDNEDAVIGLMFNLRKLGNKKKAIELGEQAFLRSNDGEIAKLLSAYYLENENWEKAKEMLEDRLKLDRDDTDILYNLGVCCDRLNEAQEAIEFLAKYIELCPDSENAEKAKKRIAELSKDKKK